MKTGNWHIFVQSFSTFKCGLNCITPFATSFPWVRPSREWESWENNWKEMTLGTMVYQMTDCEHWIPIDNYLLSCISGFIHPQNKMGKLIDHWAKISNLHLKMIPHNPLGWPRVRGCLSTVAECTTITRRLTERLTWETEWETGWDWAMIGWWLDCIPRRDSLSKGSLVGPWPCGQGYCGLSIDSSATLWSLVSLLQMFSIVGHCLTVWNRWERKYWLLDLSIRNCLSMILGSMGLWARFIVA